MHAEMPYVEAPTRGGGKWRAETPRQDAGNRGRARHHSRNTGLGRVIFLLGM